MTLAVYVALVAAALTFACASMARAIRYARLPLHLRWELYPVPHEAPERARHGGSYFEDTEWWRTPRRTNLRGEVAFIIREVLCLTALREFNRPLWVRSFPFHFGLYLLAGAFGLLLVTAIASLSIGGAIPGTIGTVLRLAYTALGASGFGLSICGAAALLQRRLTDPSLRPYTTPGDVFNLLFFIVALGLIFAGFLARPAGSPGPLAIIIGLASWDLTLQVPPLFASGLILGALLAAYVPMTHMSHFIGKYFTYHAVLWDDRPQLDNRKMAAALAEYLTYRPTWAAGHIKRSDGATWAEVVSSNPSREERP